MSIYNLHSNSKNFKIKKHKERKGFALVASISILALTVMIALAMVTLATSVTKTAVSVDAIARARANARLALAAAIARLQQYAGGDTRITASADILDENNPPLLGTWRSWEGSNQQQTGDLRGRPVAPDYGSKLVSSSDGGRFLSWLVSTANGKVALSDAKDLVSISPTQDTIPLVAQGSLAATDTRQVHIVPEMLDDSGAYAWWVSGECQKANIVDPYHFDTPATMAEWSDVIVSNPTADAEVFDLEEILAETSLSKKMVSLKTTDLVSSGTKAPSEAFHDLSVTSKGLLTNAATGGWKKDFSLLTEKWEEQATSGLEFFNLNPTEKLQYSRPAHEEDYRPQYSMLYHWSDYRESALREFWARRGPISSWDRIQSFATLYKKMSATTDKAPNISHQSWQDDGLAKNAAQTFHEIRLMPQMARVQMIVSHYATRNEAEPGKYRPAVLYTPVVTVWNPYNTKLTLNGKFIVNPSYAWPLALNHQFRGSGAPNLPQEYWSCQTGGDEYSDKCFNKDTDWHQDLGFILNEVPLVLEPGETRIFTPEENSIVEASNTRRLFTNLSPGVRNGVGFYYTLDKRLNPEDPSDVTKISVDGDLEMRVDAKFDVTSTKFKDNSYCGTAYQWFVNSWGSGLSHSWYQVFYDRQHADSLYPPIAGLASATVAQCADNPVPFLSMILGSRIANHRATATKGLVQANPVVDFFSSNGSPRFVDRYPGNNTLLNCPWDFSLVPHSSGGDDMLPNVDNSTNSSYIVTGVRKAEGISRLVAVELPIRPMKSLADLSHMQIRALNPTPPYGANLVGNSDATPLIPKDNVVNMNENSRANLRGNEQQDDSYCSNQILFDDWFFSSIAPKPTGFGSAAGPDLRQNYLNFLMGNESLANASYIPIPEDQRPTSTRAEEIFAAEVQPSESWKTIASRLEVHGMFNVNSTSVKAWRALLGHARNCKVPYNKPDGSIALSKSTDYAFSRSGIAGDLAAGEAPQVAGEYADTTEFTGYRIFEDEQLDFLAEKIVEQVRLRGPFLSLSEFVNRQLSSDTDLAIAGAIQSALNALTDDSSLNPFEAMQNESVPSEAVPFGVNPDPNINFPDPGYAFPKAAVGYNTYGLPGWTRQADILRPIVPILSARDDTFTVRAYGDFRDADGEIVAQAWCEATIQRKRDFVDSSDKPDISGQPLSPSNIEYGRRFGIISFRWLNLSEV